VLTNRTRILCDVIFDCCLIRKMEKDRIAIISRHIVLIEERVPVCGVILIDGEHITALEILPNECDFSEVSEQYSTRGMKVYDYEH
jgi:uncharacterized cysteine cluster protein YcgN (CxxCxxCC family)